MAHVVVVTAMLPAVLLPAMSVGVFLGIDPILFVEAPIRPPLPVAIRSIPRT